MELANLAYHSVNELSELIARDWQALAHSYHHIFGRVPVPSERNFSGEKLEAGTGIPGATLRGLHLRLPVYGAEGPNA